MNAFEFPPMFAVKHVPIEGATIYVRFGGRGPAVVLLHGYGETGDMWVPLASDLARDHIVVVPDLRGLGLSSKPPIGFDKKTQAGDVAGVLDDLKIDHAALVTHDIGNMVGYAFAAQYPERVTGLAPIDAPLPGVGPWKEILKNSLLWHRLPDPFLARFALTLYRMGERAPFIVLMARKRQCARSGYLTLGSWQCHRYAVHPTAILRGLACSALGRVSVSTPSFISARIFS
jgi:pimeloyl-ACP methyl ester carboxylesterase